MHDVRKQQGRRRAGEVQGVQNWMIYEIPANLSFFGRLKGEGIGDKSTTT